ncbi:hypothetical protein [uncultured Legionella sp.]|uniref:hypothetical protein n=1 Tax=uncultured Legionella sp. TaxID=210934 RepID=UPI002627D546|nr:hypothetical protein [uncultured Legionella sp.]
MLVKRVLLLIQQLDELTPLTVFDSAFRTSLHNRFHDKDPDTIIDCSDIECIERLYRERFIKTVDSDDDCLLNDEKVNQLLVGFAFDLAVDAEKKYYQILYPEITNVADYNNLSRLTETERPVNFYLGHGGKTLYRKRGLCEHLINNDFRLSTHRDFSQSKLSPITVEELTRLKFCTRTNSQFTINSESFSCFWDFLEKKSFPRLQEKGGMLLYLLPHLLVLIEQYHKLKSEKADYSIFNKAARDFFDLLASVELNNINYFYGIRVPFKENQSYLLELLTAINKSQKYELDDEFHALIVWLYQINPILKSSLPVLDSVYSSLDSKGIIYSNSVTTNTIACENANDKLHQCYALIVSLLTTSFELWTFTEQTISFWDKKNKVFPEAATIYQSFLHAIEQNSEKELLAAYSKVYDVYFNHAPVEFNIFSWCTEIKSITRWYQLVGQGKLSKIDVIWNEPEILLQSLLDFKPCNRSISPDIDLFLDKLVHTYVQNANDLLKRFRVNILFMDLFKKMSLEDKIHLKMIMPWYRLEDAKNKFLDNCARHIASRLENLSVLHSGGSLQFYTTVHRAKTPQFVLSTSEFRHVKCVIEAFKLALNDSRKKIEPKLMEKMVLFFVNITRPILTVAEIESAQNSARVIDYLGAPS